MSNNSYRFTSDQEPTDQQLHQIMKEMAVDVRAKAQQVTLQFQQQLSQMCSAERKQQR